MPRLYLLLLLLAAQLTQAANESIPAYQPRFHRQQAVVAVIGDNRMTELVDYLVPYAVLKQSAVAEVHALAMDAGPVQMMPALRLQAEQTVAEFDRQYPQGADYLIVPAVHHSDDKRLGQWVAEQASKGATIVGVCDGVLVLGYAGLLDGKRATGHWYSQDLREGDFPKTTWLRNSRYVSDGKIITTSGVSAALPASLALVQAIAGPGKASELAQQLGVRDWSAHHDSSAFGLGSAGYLTAAGNLLSFWGHETLSLAVQPGVDDIGLALQADAWSRTFRSKVIASSTDGQPVITRNGLRLLVDDADQQAIPLAAGTGNAIEQLDGSLAAIATRYGRASARLVSQQLEYPSNLNQ